MIGARSAMRHIHIKPWYSSSIKHILYFSPALLFSLKVTHVELATVGSAAIGWDVYMNSTERKPLTGMQRERARLASYTARAPACISVCELLVLNLAQNV